MKKILFAVLGTLLIIGIVWASETITVTTITSSATNIAAFGTRGAKKISVYYVCTDSCDTVWTRVTGATISSDTFLNLDANGDTTKVARSGGSIAHAFGIVIEDVPPYMKVEIDSLAGNNESIIIKTIFEY